MNKCLLSSALCGILASTLLFSCSESDTGKANQLLDDARQAMNSAQFDEARHLIDSLRATYPKEFDARRTALVLADSVELQEAKAMKVKTDSLVVFKELDLNDAKEKFTFEKKEKYQSQGYYVLPKYAGVKTAFRFFPEVEETGKMLLVQIDAKRKYTFTEVPVSEEGYANIIKGMNLDETQKHDVAECYKLAELFAEYHKEKETKNKTDLKIRFFEKKLSEKK